MGASSGAEAGFFQKWAGYQASVNTQTVKVNKTNMLVGKVPMLLSDIANYGVLVLGEKWYKDAFGALIAFTKDDYTPVAVLPNTFSGYSFTDPHTGERMAVNAKTAALFDADAICFYQPLTQKKLEISDLIAYMQDHISFSDLAMVVGATFAATLVGMLMPQVSRTLTGPVLSSGSSDALVAIAIFIVCTLVSMQLINSIKDMVQARLGSKISLGVEASMMMRLLSLPASFFRKSGLPARRSASSPNG